MSETLRHCKDCTHYFVDGEGWELPQFDFPNCAKHPYRANLKSFPFHSTVCPSWQPVSNTKEES